LGSFWFPQEHGFDALVTERLPSLRQLVPKRRPIEWLIRQYQVRTGKPNVYSYKTILPKLIEDQVSNNRDYPCVIPNWDNTPRKGLFS